MLDDSIRTETGLSAREYRDRQSAYWEREARECLKLDMHDEVKTCLDNAAWWRQQTGAPLAEMIDGIGGEP
jgi:hypothetical protein